MLEKLSLNMQALLKNVKDKFDDAVAVDRNWQTTARESFEFRDNKQWTRDEEDQLRYCLNAPGSNLYHEFGRRSRRIRP